MSPQKVSANTEEQACSLYGSGSSLRKVQAATGIGRETLRRALRQRGIARDRLAYHGDPLERILGKVIVNENECWEWTGTVNNMGYGMTTIDGRRTLVHRAVWRILRDRPPTGLDACHKCDNTRCCNPQHIFFGTRADNMQDAARKGRTLKGERAPRAKLTDALVLEMRRRFAAGEGQSVIGRSLGISNKAVFAVVRRKAWTHLP